MPRRPTTNTAGLERTLRALKPNLTPQHEALVALARTLATAVDSDPCADCGAGQNAALWKEYRAALMALTEAGTGDDVDDDTKDWLVKISTPRRATVGDAPQS